MMASTGDKRDLYRMIIKQMKYDGYASTAQNVGEDTLTAVSSEEVGENTLETMVAKSMEVDVGQEGARKLDTWNTVYSYFGQGEKMINRFYAANGTLIKSLQFSQDGQYLLAGDATGGTHLFLVSKMLTYKGEAKSASSTALTRVYGEATQSIEDVGFSPRASVIFSASRDGAIRMFNYTLPRSKRAIAIFKDDHSVNTMAMHPSGFHILSGTDHPVVRLWDIRQEKAFRAPDPISDHGSSTAGFVNALDFSPDGRTFVSGTSDGTMKIWDPSQPKWVVMPIEMCHSGAEVTSVQYSKTGNQILTAGKDSCIRIFDTRTYKCLSMFGRPKQIRHKAIARFTAHEEAVTAILASKSKPLVIDRNMTDTLHVTPSTSAVSETHFIRALALSPVAPFVAAGDEFKVRLWTPLDHEDQMIEGAE
eukprot:TRINITY_DN6717_c0_g1_i1.p1 TRINITY_DN6717_c0_g1~~TRINITY_DN6717_c0_g1_i1.p1  ORF type:complete len:420 (+),score=54.66 TRINITY_DN6717_c0_g1_i1:51-1310(+)